MKIKLYYIYALIVSNNNHYNMFCKYYFLTLRALWLNKYFKNSIYVHNLFQKYVKSINKISINNNICTIF